MLYCNLYTYERYRAANTAVPDELVCEVGAGSANSAKTSSTNKRYRAANAAVPDELVCEVGAGSACRADLDRRGDWWYNL